MFRICFLTDPPTADREPVPPGVNTDPDVLKTLTQYEGQNELTMGFAWYSDERFEVPAFDPSTQAPDGIDQILEINTDEYFVRFTQGLRPLTEDELAQRAAERAQQEAALIRQYDGIVQRHLDAVAKSFGYGDPNRPEVSPILHAISYAEEPAVERFMNEGRALRAWRSLVWVAAAGILNAVKAGERGVPTEAELLAELPHPPTQDPL
ncbi:hypothetical protein ACFQUU_08825 [Herbaspirillum sp. GCM10030257]|uniref:hypothetical protein n=1 Tax=Herbaspirillum sp. GCM10030257 TaxID=3273393 RepID=UPI003615490E